MAYETYVFILCLIVYVVLVALSSFVVVMFTKMTIKLILHGAEDEKIKKEYAKRRKGKSKFGIVDCIVSLLFCAVFLVAFGFSLYVNVQGDKFFANVPTMKVVNSASMSKKHEKNTYLFENGLDNQFQTFDLISLYKLPSEAELQLYDIVLYEVDETLIIHRIVEIEEPNDRHPNERWFLLQGDAVERADRFPVRYSQMRAIYRGERIPYVGSFVAFLQSPAGWLCIILIVVAVIATPIFEKKVAKAKEQRYQWLLAQRKIAKPSQNATMQPSNALRPMWGILFCEPPAPQTPPKKDGKGGEQ